MEQLLGMVLDNSITGTGVTWGGDNTGTGVESILFTKSEFTSNNPGINTVSFDMRAAWWENVGNNPVVISVTSYAGGTMIYDSDNFTWTNPTANDTFVGFATVSKVITGISLSMKNRIHKQNLEKELLY
jgi:hypothetical protein